MSIKNWPGGRISPTPPTPSGPYENSTASGVWTLDQVAYWEQQNQWPTAGNVNPSAFIENLFQTWLYTGNGSTQTITNGIDLSTNGGLVWIKSRSTATDHALFDTARGASNGFLSSNTTGTPYASPSSDLTSFGASGFSITNSTGNVNVSSSTYASWTFRKQAKFFDVVTWTGNGTAGRTVAHSLGSVPGCIIVKQTSASGQGWAVYHRSEGQGRALLLNDTAASFLASGYWNSTAPTDTVFTLGSSATVNGSGSTYVAYLFAHNAGGFGLTGTDNVISCGSFTGGSPATVNLGYEPQWLLIKSATNADNWYIFDTMRGWTVNYSGLNYLIADSSGAENTGGTTSGLTNTGFNFNYGSGQTFIYIAIRRGPMKTPTTGTSVFAPYVTSSLNNLYNAGFVTDWVLQRYAANTDGWYTGPRLIGKYYMKTETTAAEVFSAAANWDSNTGAWNFNANYGLYAFQRAPGFFDVVCYTGTGVNRTVTHNLGVAPELMIVKNRSSAGYGWLTYSATLGATKYLQINSTAAEGTVSTYWNNTAPTSSVFSVGTAGATNASGDTFVAYLFASCPGVSKVGSYTGTGALQTINCGFTGGARFVLIKRTDSTGDWYVYDSARGISSGNDPYLFLNSTAAEVTGTNYVDTTSVGFQVTAAAPAGLNANGGTYIYLAIA